MFIRGNTFSFLKDKSLILHKNGTPSLYTVDYQLTEPVPWQLVGNQEALLSCGQLPPSQVFSNGKNRIINFHDNGEYHRGCSLINNVVFQIDQDQITIGSHVDLELHRSGFLKYTSRLQEGLQILSYQKEQGLSFQKKPTRPLKLLSPPFHG